MRFRRKISSRIEYIYNEYYEEIAGRRFSYLMQHSAKCCEAFSLPESVKFSVSRVRMEAIIKSYFLDVIRFKEYHFEPDIDIQNQCIEDLVLSKNWIDSIHREKHLSSNKIAAFTIKWFVKHAPVSFIIEDNSLLSDEEEYIINSANPRIAVLAGFDLMNLNLYHVDTIQLHRFVYHLMYRWVDDRALFGWLEVFKHDENGTDSRYQKIIVSEDDDI